MDERLVLGHLCRCHHGFLMWFRLPGIHLGDWSRMFRFGGGFLVVGRLVEVVYHIEQLLIEALGIDGVSRAVIAIILNVVTSILRVIHRRRVITCEGVICIFLFILLIFVPVLGFIFRFGRSFFF